MSEDIRVQRDRRLRWPVLLPAIFATAGASSSAGDEMLATLLIAAAGAVAAPEPLTGGPGAVCSTASNATAAVYGLLHRLLPAHVALQFHLEHCPLPPRHHTAATGLVDTFELLAGGPSPMAVIHIRGSSGVALASGQFECNNGEVSIENHDFRLKNDDLCDRAAPLSAALREHLILCKYTKRVCSHVPPPPPRFDFHGCV